MKILFKIIMFMVFFNLAAFLVAATGFFHGNTLYGDVTVYNPEDENYDLSDPYKLPTPEQMFDKLISGGPKVGPYDISWNFIIFTLIIATGVVGALLRSTVLVSIALVITLFFMFNNSQTLFRSIAGNMDASVMYIGLMIGIGVFIIVVLTIMDYAAGQSSSGR